MDSWMVLNFLRSVVHFLPTQTVLIILALIQRHHKHTTYHHLSTVHLVSAQIWRVLFCFVSLHVTWNFVFLFFVLLTFFSLLSSSSTSQLFRISNKDPSTHRWHPSLGQILFLFSHIKQILFFISIGFSFFPFFV